MHIAEAAEAAAPTPDLAAPERWLDSRRRARARRREEARAATRRRLSGRGAATIAAVMVLGSGGAVAAQRTTTPAAPKASITLVKTGSRGALVKALQSALGIPADGIFGRMTARAVRRYQRSKGLAVDGIAGPATLGALGITTRTAPRPLARVQTGASSRLERIAACESGGDPTAVSVDGRYRGKYQFSRATWRRLGGSGDPAKAPEAEQDRIAARLLAREGTAPWPNCG